MGSSKGQIKAAKEHFPKIYRFITERIFTSKRASFYKVFTVSFVSGLLLIAIISESILLLHNTKKAKIVAKERQNVIWEIAYWKSVNDIYVGYRDIYHRIAVLEYKLGDKEESRKYVKKTLEIDPNFEESRVLGAKVGL